MTHHHLRFDLFHGFQCHTDQNDDRRTAHHQASHVGEVGINQRNDRNKGEEECPDEGDPRQNLGDIVGGRLAGTDTADGTVVLAKVVAHLDGIILDGHIEIGKTNNQQEVQENVHPAAHGKQREEALPEVTLDIFLTDKQEDGRGNRKNGTGEDDRHNTRKTDFDRQIGALSAIHLAADHSLRILDGNAAFGIVHENDDPDDNEEEQDEDDREDDLQGIAGQTSLEGFPQGAQRHGQSGDNADEQQNGDTVADTLLVDLFTEPHHQSRTGSKDRMMVMQVKTHSKFQPLYSTILER